MFSFTAQVQIDREPAVVGNFLLEPMRWPEWTDMRDVRVLTEGPIGLGMRARATIGTGLLSEGAAISLAMFPVLFLVVIVQLLYIRRVETR